MEGKIKLGEMRECTAHSANNNLSYSTSVHSANGLPALAVNPVATCPRDKGIFEMKQI